jgi:hypothetical protein
MLTDENANTVERSEYTVYGEPTVLGGCCALAATANHPAAEATSVLPSLLA